jgi:hypothetical protein
MRCDECHWKKEGDCFCPFFKKGICMTRGSICTGLLQRGVYQDRCYKKTYILEVEV